MINRSINKSNNKQDNGYLSLALYAPRIGSIGIAPHRKLPHEKGSGLGVPLGLLKRGSCSLGIAAGHTCLEASMPSIFNASHKEHSWPESQPKTVLRPSTWAFHCRWAGYGRTARDCRILEVERLLHRFLPADAELGKHIFWQAMSTFCC